MYLWAQYLTVFFSFSSFLVSVLSSCKREEFVPREESVKLPVPGL